MDIYINQRTGEKFEVDLPATNELEDKVFVIKPLVTKKNWYWLYWGQNDIKKYHLELDYELTPDQAQAIADSIEALMDWLTNEIPKYDRDKRWIKLLRIGEDTNELLVESDE